MSTLLAPHTLVSLEAENFKAPHLALDTTTSSVEQLVMKSLKNSLDLFCFRRLSANRTLLQTYRYDAIQPLRLSPDDRSTESKTHEIIVVMRAKNTAVPLPHDLKRVVAIQNDEPQL